MHTSQRNPLRRPSLILSWCMLVILVTMQPILAFADEFELSLLFDGFWSECYENDPSLFRTIAGGMADLRVTIKPAHPEQPDPLYRGITDWTWPEGLTVEVDAIGPDGELVPPARVLPQLHMEYYLNIIQVQNDSVWRATNWVPESYFRFPQYNFSFRLPVGLTENRLRFRVRFDHAEYGLLEASRELEIVVPCTEVDTDRLRDSYLLLAAKAGNFERVVSYVDSFMTLGWKSQYGLMKAYHAAHRLQQYNKALHYLDSCYQVHGSVSFPGRSDESDTVRNRNRFEMLRSETIDFMNQQQQH